MQNSNITTNTHNIVVEYGAEGTPESITFNFTAQTLADIVAEVQNSFDAEMEITDTYEGANVVEITVEGDDIIVTITAEAK